MKRMVVLLVIFFMAFPPASSAEGFMPPLSPKEMIALLPHGDFVSGWVWKEKPRIYTREDLFELIDGEAESYFQYGFVNAASGIYGCRRDPQSLLTVDIFQMDDRLMSFGIYSTYLSPESRIINLGSESFGDSNYLYVYQGRFFARIYCSCSKSVKAPVIDATKSILTHIPDRNCPPPQLNMLPSKNRVPHSERVITRGFLGQDAHPPAIEAEFRVKDRLIKGFIIISSNEERNQEIVSKLSRQFQSTTMVEKKIGEHKVLYGPTKYYKGFSLCAMKKTAVGAYMLEDFDDARSLMVQMMKDK
jgi:hypothetical protein